MMIKISFDFDDTLAVYETTGTYNTTLCCKPLYIDLVKEYHALGCHCIILTARFKNQFNEMEIKEFIERCNLPIKEIVYTGHLAKGIFAYENDVKMHYDDDPFHLESVKAYDIIAVDSINHKIF
ncbi:MAG: hypothetical protein EKK64_00545 [Neisseriaceae bacterium]|nr:MAG: hypothetical protein EKK64_00545 [Neisseriaceae bacterium]